MGVVVGGECGEVDVVYEFVGDLDCGLFLFEDVGVGWEGESWFCEGEEGEGFYFDDLLRVKR